MGIGDWAQSPFNLFNFGYDRKIINFKYIENKDKI